MTPAGLRQLLVNTAVAHALPGITVRFRSGSQPLLFVGGERHGRGAPWISSCALRRGVSEALICAEAANEVLSFLDLPEGTDPTIEMGGKGSSQVHPGGIASAVIDNRIVHLFATTLNAAQVRATVSQRSPDNEPFRCNHPHRIRLHSDTGLRVTLVSAELPSWADSHEVIAAELALQHVLACCCAQELASDLHHLQLTI
jgi:hypothetical protein